MRHGEVRRTGTVSAVCALLLAALAACGDPTGGGPTGGNGGDGSGGGGDVPPKVIAASRIPGVGSRLRGRIPTGTRQVVAVYGDGRDSADSTVVLYAEHGPNWVRVRSWPGHNGKKGWTLRHRAGDNRSPVGVFTLTDAGGVLADPGSGLPYTRSAAFAAPRWWARSHWHDFDYVIAIDYNRVKGAPPNDPKRPEGEEKGGGIWLHMDHGSGTSACVSLSRAAMEYLLRTLDPDRRPVVVMGDRAALEA
ncbi:L,D-transpeptidase family protein [Streptomyces sp. AK04-3B]|uniref:L,D-transpeptidase family protein n=1 Tax=unclassified Streptomyces TaxID=2593676 RepID=UPI0029A731B7|nr:L,D-transpeptidase family protein [Streptomyces sp. AK04-3B]MDX3803435.1 L,D-transpeptidase family protein [Streptomyces sp. AK04-3B]